MTNADTGRKDSILSVLSRREFQARIAPVDNQALAAAAFARTRLFQSARKTFISALSPRSRGTTPLYFFVIPLTLRLTAPWLTRL